ncbi:dephospho-CoA kinase [Pseudoalteromonas sp. A601]|uniref:dephospho-CoA kinase n=1 Tax=Pseudoalteromonas sp. A601 TaxID=1967839 RepID=UPI000B3C899C|nr:dephospho-CoA kinase [Pseudoalteromonas sp. A601]OUS68296.1 dephospho-CoA kinase [Pseudoalteromonas sp. A601]
MAQKHKINNWVLGLTGGIGSGKSAVSEMFEKLNIAVVDADIVARQVVAPQSEGLNAITAHFGTNVLNPDGSLNRSHLREIIFADNEQKTWLNNLLHPLIREKLLTDLANATSEYVILVAPLLFENNLDQYCQRTLVVDVPEEVQLARTTKRDGVTELQTKSIIAAQMSRQDKLEKADDIIDNNRCLDLVEIQLQKLHYRYLALAKQAKVNAK